MQNNPEAAAGQPGLKIGGNIAEKYLNLKDESMFDAVAMTEQTNKLHEKAQIDSFNQSVTRTAVIRYLTLVIDFSNGSLKEELRPNRAIVIQDLLSVSNICLLV